MLIINQRFLPCWEESNALRNWPGPHVLIIYPDSGLSRAQVVELNRCFIIIEYLQSPINAAGLFGDVLGWLDVLQREDGASILFIDGPFDAGLLAEQSERSAKAPNAVEAEMAKDGRVAMLRFGQMVATSPLLPEFFKCLPDPTISDAILVELLQDIFHWEYS